MRSTPNDGHHLWLRRHIYRTCRQQNSHSCLGVRQVW